MAFTIDRFQADVMQQVALNRQKWEEADQTKDVKDFMLIAQEQLGQLAKTVLDHDYNIGTKREVIHTVAVLYEIYARVVG